LYHCGEYGSSSGPSFLNLYSDFYQLLAPHNPCPAEVCFSWIKLWPIVLQTHGTLEVREIRFPGEGHLQVHHSAAKLR